MDKRPKRRRHRDNQYYLKSYNSEKYIIEFIDVNHVKKSIEVSKELFAVFDRFELDDKKLMNEEEKHYERFDLSENNLHTRLLNKDYQQNLALQNLKKSELIKSIEKLSKVQQRRILLYFFYDLKLREIALIEECSIVSVKNSIDLGLKKLKKLLS